MKKSLIALSAMALCMSAAVGDTGGTGTGATAPSPGQMSFSDYVPLAMRTCKTLPPDQHLLHAELGLITELGELADNIKKHIIYGKPFDGVNLMEEVADCCWYLAIWMHQKGVGGIVVDEAIAEMRATSTSTLKAEAATDPWAMVKATKALGGMIIALGMPIEDRGFVTDKQVVQVIASLMDGFLDYAGFTMADALATNIAKLRKRYPGLGYSNEDALNRDTAAERAVLENVAAS